MSSIKAWIADRREEAEDQGLCDEDVDQYVQDCWGERVDHYLESRKYDSPKEAVCVIPISDDL